jgi:PAS domain S-box-containing protein
MIAREQGHPELEVGRFGSTSTGYRKGIEGAVATVNSAQDQASDPSELNKIINAIPVMAWSTLPDGTADFFNERFLSFLGLTAETAYGWGWTSSLHPDELESLTCVWTALIASGRPGETEARLRRSDGQYRWFLFRANPVYADDGSVTRWYGTNTDIDDRKRAEEALRRSAAFLAQGQTLTETGSVWWKPLTQEIFWSDEAYRVAGYPKTQQPSVELMLSRCHPEDLAEVGEMVAQAAENGANLELEHRLLMPHGEIKYVRIVLQNIGPDRAAPEFIGAVTDITRRKIAEEQLRRSEMLLAEGQRISLTGTFSWQVETDEITFSSELHRIFGFPKDTVVDFDLITERVYQEDLPLLAEKMSNVRAGSDNSDYEIRLKVAGQVKHVRVVGRLVKHLNGRAECLGAVQDVTAQRVAEEARDKLRSELAQIARVMSLNTMAAAIAHEVNQPLAGIVTNASTSLHMLSADPPNIGGALETARRTIRDGNRAADVITRLRVLFKRGTSTGEPVDINEAALEVVSLLSTDFHRHRISLRTELSQTLPLIKGDRVQLQQVIMNFLRNSIDAIGDVSHTPRDIIVRTELGAEKELRVSVEDTGCGIEAMDSDRLFDAFHTTKADGMGIGLSISRSIVEAHDGKIWARGNSVIGATFGFSIPGNAERRLNDSDMFQVSQS